MIRHRPGDDTPRAHLNEIADPDVAQDLRACTDHHSVADGGMSLARVFTGSAERYSLVQEHVVAEFRCLADHDSHAVIDEESAANPRTRMDFDTRDGSRKLAHHPRRSEPSGTIQPVRETMQQDGVKPGITKQDFE